MLELLKKYRIIVICTAVILVCGITASYAWLTLSDRAAKTTPLEVELPPILYICDNNAQDMEVLSLDGLVIGEPYELVFAVTSVMDVFDDNLAGSVTYFVLQLAHTNNLGANYDIYAADYLGTTPPSDMSNILRRDTRYYRKADNPMPFTDVSTSMNEKAYEDVDPTAIQEKNLATYQLFGSVPSTSLMFDPPDDPVTDALFDTGKVRFFVLHIYWTGTVPDVESKETDMVYVVTRGGSES